MELKFYLVLATGLIPLLVGMIWYSKALFANAWMQASGMTEEKGKNMNMIVIFILVYVFGIMLSVALMPIVIHQMGVFSVFADDKTPEGQAYLKHFFDTYGTRFRTFKHGVFHGVISSIFFALPVIGIGSLFEAKGWKYMAIHLGYWMLTFALIGGVICQFA